MQTKTATPRPRRLLPILTALGLGLGFVATPRHATAGTFSHDCSMASVSCEGLLGDVVTEKFTRAFPHTKFQIFVYSDVTTFDDGSGVATAIVGVVPTRRGSHAFFPNRVWKVTRYAEHLGNAYARTELARSIIRRATENMMASCADSPTCDILGSTP